MEKRRQEFLQLQRACRDQRQIRTASVIFMILARTAELRPESECVAKMLPRARARVLMR
jgi:hypothetical protein